MSSEIYSALSGAMAAWREMDVVANNLANSATDGFKEQRLVFESMGREDGAEFSDGYVAARHQVSDLSDGAVHVDDVDTHLALQGEGFFSVESDDGEALLVRSGRFMLDEQGILVTESGHAVLGQGGPIQIPEGATMVVSSDGRVSTAEGDELGRLDIVTAEDVVPLGNLAWRPIGEVLPAEGVQVVQGAVETSNTDPLRGMTDLMHASRYFELYHKAMQASDELDGRINDMTRT